MNICFFLTFLTALLLASPAFAATWPLDGVDDSLMQDANLAGRENTSRTSYLVTGPQSCLLFMSARVPGQYDKTLVAETTDGGATFQFVSWVVPLLDPYRAVMPAVARLEDGTIVVTMRRREVANDKPCWVDCYRSTDNGRTLSFMSRVGDTGTSNGNPPGLTAFEDGRLVCVYGNRDNNKILARISADGGKTWDGEIVLRDDFQPDTYGDRDLGYPRVVVNHENRIVTMYYWATQNLPQHHIAGTTWTVPQGIINLPQNTTLTYNLTWTGNPDGSGTLSGTLAGQAVSVAMGAGTGNFTAFGLLSGGTLTSNPQLTGQFYFDDLTYNEVASDLRQTGNPFCPRLRSGPMALSGASRGKQSPGSEIFAYLELIP